MKNNSSITQLLKLLSIIFTSLMVLIVTSTDCTAQEWSRKGKGEIFVLGQSMSGDTTTGLGLTVEIDDTIVGGLGFGYNFGDHFNLNLDFFAGSTDITAKGYSSKVKVSTDISGLDINLDINILKSRFTPMITGGIGYITFKGEVGSTSFDETDSSYNVGGGLRWDITNHLLVKALYRATWTKLEDTDKSVRFDGVSLSIGYIF